MKKDLSEISTYELGVLQSTAHRLTLKIKSDYLAVYGLTPAQWYLLGHIYDAGEDGIRLNDLRKTLDSSMPFITTTVNYLEAKGFIHKTSKTEDSRVKIARVNPKHIPMIEEIEEGLRNLLRSELYGRDHITREELAAYASVIMKIADKNC